MVYRLFFMYDTGDFMNDMMFANKDFVFSILENSYDGIYITNKDSITVYVNKAYENLTGHKRSEYIGKHMDDLIKSGIMKVHITGDVISSKKSITVTEELVSGKNVLKNKRCQTLQRAGIFYFKERFKTMCCEKKKFFLSCRYFVFIYF